jgi:two-component system response regulator AtoC
MFISNLPESLVLCVLLIHRGSVLDLAALTIMTTKTNLRSSSGERAARFPPVSIIFGHSAIMQSVRQKIDKSASSGVPILIQGDSGTGKGLLALFIHSISAQPHTPFIKVNCAAIPGTLLESEMFGYEKGAFTGAQAVKPGRVELADGGTLFLDGIDEIEMSLQAKLLQLLQDGQFTRIGGQEDRKVQIRVICATNRRLEDEITAGRFRRDLYYRINVVSVEMPSLRARSEDIRELAAYFLENHSVRHNVSAKPLSQAALTLLEKHSWPGNIRELENMMERYVILGSEDAISTELLNWERSHEVHEAQIDGQIHLKKVTRQAVHDLERKIIMSVLEANRWNRKRTASALKISYRALLYKIRRAGLPPKRSVNGRGAKPDRPAASAD